MAIPYTGLFIAASCDSRFSHGRYILLSTQQWHLALDEPAPHEPHGQASVNQRGLHFCLAT
jgi:hypothetical protein